MTYHLNSDILFGYGGIDDISSGKRISPARNIKWKAPTENFTGLNLIFSKSISNSFHFRSNAF